MDPTILKILLILFGFLWAITFFLFNRMIKRRDDIECKIGKTLDSIKNNMGKLETRVAVNETKINFKGNSAANRQA